MVISLLLYISPDTGFFRPIRKEIARCLLPDIVAYFESEQGQREFEEWKAQQEAAKKEKSEVA